MLNKFKNFICDQAGGFAIAGAMVLATATLITGGAIDTARYMNANAKFKSCMDTALLSAVAVARTHDNLDDVAAKFFGACFPEGYSDTEVLSDIKVIADQENFTWTLEGNGAIEMRFGGFIGIDEMPVTHKVKVSWDVSKRVEAVFAVDTSASMCMDVERTPKEDGTYKIEYIPDYTCKKFNAMKEAMGYVIDEGLAPIQGEFGPMVYAGIIPFNHKVRFPNPNNLPLPLKKSEETLAKGDPEYFANFDDVDPLSEIIPLRGINTEDEKLAMRDLIDNMKQSPTGNGWTRSNIAALTAALMLDPDHYSSFGGDLPEDFGPNNVDKIVVLMSDGANMGCCYAAHQEGNFDNQYLYLYKSDNAHLVGLDKMPEMRPYAEKYGIAEEGLCDTMKAQGIKIYSILLDVDKNDPGGEAMHDVYKSCATNDQYFFDVKDSKDLELAYKTLAQSIFKPVMEY